MDSIEGRVNAVVDRVQAIPTERLNRVLGVSVGVPAWVVLGIAAWLTPASEGFGTHQQLGLGGCTLLTLTGWPCPMCGMTTSFSLYAEGRVLEAVVNQPFSAVIFLATVIGAGLGTWDALTGRGSIRAAVGWLERRERLWAVFLLAGMTLGWVYKMIRMHPEVFG